MKKDEKLSTVKRANVKRRDIDLIRALRYAKSEKVKEKKAGRPGGFIYIIGALLVAGAAGAYIMTSLNYSQLNDENEGLLADISLAGIKAAQAEQLDAKLDWVKNLEKNTSAQLSALDGADSQYDYYTRDLFTKIRGQFMQGITVDYIEIGDGTVTLNLTADSQSKAAELVKRLRSQGIFTSIEYGGFEAGEGESQTSFTIVCGLSEEASAEEARNDTK